MIEERRGIRSWFVEAVEPLGSTASEDHSRDGPD